MKIALIGMPTSGKSTISKILNEKLNIPVVDVDKLLEYRFKSSLQEFIDMYGEKKFLEEEDKILIEIEYPEDCIISTGGSVIYAEEAMNYLQSQGVKFYYLAASLDILENRLSQQRNMRGIVMNGCTSWHDLLIDRDKLYRRYADYIIETDSKDLEEITNEIIKNKPL